MTPDTPRHPCIVVGYDGSAAAEAAVEYAVGRTRDHGSTVIVYAFEPPNDMLGFPDYDRVLEDRRSKGQAALDALVMEHAEDLIDEGVETELLTGTPADAIMRVARAREADEIAVGSRGFGRARALLGSVSHDLVHKADRPLVVIPH